jgi:magnesium-transporting ATPase (P-type)
MPETRLLKIKRGTLSHGATDEGAYIMKDDTNFIYMIMLAYMIGSSTALLPLNLYVYLWLPLLILTMFLCLYIFKFRRDWLEPEQSHSIEYRLPKRPQNVKWAIIFNVILFGVIIGALVLIFIKSHG